MEYLQQELQFKYDGEEHLIDINTFVSSQMHIAAVLAEIQAKLFPDQQLQIKLRGFSEGSFITDLVLQLPTAQSVLTGAQTIQPLISVFAGLVTLANFLGGRKPREVTRIGDDIEITINGENNTVFVVQKDAFDLYKSNPTINNALRKNFETLSDDDNVEGFSVLDLNEGSEILNINRTEFERTASPNPYFETDTRDDFDNEAVLTIKRPDFFPRSDRSKWEFHYQGRTIKAAIKDDGFNRRISEGLRIGKGDRIKVMLRKVMKYDQNWDEYLEHGFEVCQVTGIIPRGDDPTLFQAHN